MNLPARNLVTKVCSQKNECVNPNGAEQPAKTPKGFMNNEQESI